MAIPFIHSDLIAWQEAIKLVEAVYRDTESFPHKETFGLTRADQARGRIHTVESGRGRSQEFQKGIRTICRSIVRIDGGA